MHPYFLGLWLGDGLRNTPAIANNHEEEIRNFLSRYAGSLDLHLSHWGGLTYGLVGRQLAARDRPLPPVVGPEGRDPVRRAGPRRTSYKSVMRQRREAGLERVYDYGGRVAHWRRASDGAVVKLRVMEPDSAAEVVQGRLDDSAPSPDADGKEDMSDEMLDEVLEDLFEEDEDPLPELEESDEQGEEDDQSDARTTKRRLQSRGVRPKRSRFSVRHSAIPGASRSRS